jgi:hypothetical protein
MKGMLMLMYVRLNVAHLTRYTHILRFCNYEKLKYVIYRGIFLSNTTATHKSPNLCHFYLSDNVALKKRLYKGK